MSDQDLFNEGNKDKAAAAGDQASAAGNNDADDLTNQLLASITNEDGKQKYASVEDALKANAHAQAHIKKLEDENAQLKAQGNPTEKLDELLDAIKSKGSGQGDDKSNASTMKPEDVLGIVKDYFNDTKANEAREHNVKTVTNHFKNRYGKDASEKLYGKASDLGLSKADINKLIVSNPQAALKILGETQGSTKPASDPVTSGGHNSTAAFQGSSESDPYKGKIMGLSKASDLTQAFKNCQQRTLKRLGVES